ncbi:MAG TPA: DinB family protein [Candidatus Eisenbacteria bacterium]|nr:DinB family protein [Candidatus Eisenbacteria bacterium]
MTHDQQIRQLLAKALDWGEAHAAFPTAVSDFPEDLRGEVPPGFSHSAWELLEHLRVALWDIVEFTKDARHKSPPWPGGYWPPSRLPPQEEAWQQSIDSIADLFEEMRSLVLDRSRPLLEPFPRSQGQTLMREALLVADHNAYHLGQLVQLRKALKCWPK